MADKKNVLNFHENGKRIPGDGLRALEKPNIVSGWSVRTAQNCLSGKRRNFSLNFQFLKVEQDSRSFKEKDRLALALLWTMQPTFLFSPSNIIDVIL